MVPRAARDVLAVWEPWLGAVVDVLEPPLGGGDGPLGIEHARDPSPLGIEHARDPSPLGIEHARDPSPLAGLTVGVKELFAVAGAVRRSGAPGLVDEVPQPASAPAVQRLLDAGATVPLTTATHQFAYGVVTPRTRNPRAPDRIAGGSSGGSAAAVAAGLVDVGLGTDTGGSVRIPAACCGVVGLKTTFGLVPVAGVQPLAPSLDTVGPIARDVATCAAAFRALAAVDVAPPARPLRVGVVEELASVGLDDDVRAVWTAALADLEAGGATLRRVELPLLPSANGACRRVLGAEALAVHAALLAARPGPEGWEQDVRERLELARGLDPGLLASARDLAVDWREQVRAILAGVDVLVTPTLPCRIPARGVQVVEVAGRPQPIAAALTRLTNPWNLAGVPAGSVPAGLDRDGAPVGVQVIGPWHGEGLVLAAMEAIERLRPAAAPPAPPPGS